MRARRLFVGAGAVVTVIGLLAGGSAATYVVQKGDTLASVAASQRVSLRDLAAANGIKDVHKIYAGAKLNVPSRPAAPAAKPAAPAPTSSYVVQKGDTLERIARRLGTTTADLMRLNGLKRAGLVQLGRRLVVPAPPPVTISVKGLPLGLVTRPERLALMPSMERWAKTYGVPADLFKAMTWLESGWQNDKVSSTGARGVGQLMPDTVAFVSGTLLRARLDPRKADDNIRMSARFLRYLLDNHGGKADKALASYYQGLRSVRERGLYEDTKQYVAGVLALRTKFA